MENPRETARDLHNAITNACLEDGPLNSHNLIRGLIERSMLEVVRNVPTDPTERAEYEQKLERSLRYPLPVEPSKQPERLGYYELQERTT